MDRTEHIAMVRKHLRLGDTVTHTRCMGCLEEHIVTGWDPDWRWITGRMAADTVRIEDVPADLADVVHDDIAPGNITHINRNRVDCLDLIVAPKQRR